MGIELVCKPIFLLLILDLCFIRTDATYYYELRAHVQIDGFTKTLLGDFAGYSSYGDTSGELILLEDDFGCPGWSSNRTFSSNYILFLRRTGCSDYEQASTAFHLRPAPNGLVFYYTPDSDRDRLSPKPEDRPKLSTMTVAITKIYPDDLARLDNLDPGNPAQVRISGHYHQNFRTSQTFYFVVFAFCILMLLSCLWFVMSYMRRCHHSCRNRQRRAHTAAAARVALNQLAVRTHKTSKGTEDPTCAVCLEAFINHDAIRVLPCKHEFHKKCVDPWLKIKRTCPMCKRNILDDDTTGSRRARARARRASGSHITSSGNITHEERAELNRLVAAEDDDPEIQVEGQQQSLEEVAVAIEADPQSLPSVIPIV